MVLLRSFNQIISIIIFFIKKDKLNNNMISSKEVIKNLPQFSPASIKKSITKLVNAKILISISGPNGGFKSNPKIKLEDVSMLELFKLSEINSNMMVMYEFNNDIFKNIKKANSAENKLHEIMHDSFGKFLSELDKYKIKDLL